MKRKIEIDTEHVIEAIEATKGAAMRAIQYATTWGLTCPKYQLVRIHVSKDFEIEAQYRETPEQEFSQPNFYMLGIYNQETGEYIFHS